MDNQTCAPNIINTLPSISGLIKSSLVQIELDSRPGRALRTSLCFNWEGRLEELRREEKRRDEKEDKKGDGEKW